MATKKVDKPAKKEAVTVAAKFEAIGEVIEALAQHHGAVKDAAKELKELLKG